MMRASKKVDVKHDEEQTAAELEAIVTTWIEAANARDFSDTSPLWNHKAHFWECELAMSAPKLNLHQHMEKSKEVAATNPEYIIKVQDMHTDVLLKKGTAQVFTNAEIHGIPAGVIRKSVMIITFREIEGEWVGVRQQTLPGMDGSGG